MRKCIKCEGHGRIPAKTNCLSCYGTGHKLDKSKMPIPCNKCFQGKIDTSEICPRCKGRQLDPEF